MSLLFLILSINLSAAENSYQELIERKYQTPAKKFHLIHFGPTTKILWFDWEREWWGTFNVIETDPLGRPLYWYDIPQSPTAQSIHNIRPVTISGQKYIEVIDHTHMGNGHFHLYHLGRGTLHLRLRARVFCTIGGYRFSPEPAQIEYLDSDHDGDTDVILSGSLTHEDDDNQITDAGPYVRLFLNENGAFPENKSAQPSPKELMD